MRKLFALMALVTLAFTACNKGEETSASKSSIVAETTVVEFSRLGGEQVVRFSIKQPQGGSVTAVESCEWMDAVVEFNSDLIITVQPNESEARESKVTLKYEHAKDVTITVKQRANTGGVDVEFKAKRFEGAYFGDSGVSTYNYYIIISDIGAKPNGSGKPNGTYYYFDLYSDVDSDVLPNGTYTLDSTNSFAALTIAANSSVYNTTNNDGNVKVAMSYKSATVTVEDNKFEAIIELENGEKHLVTYDGDLGIYFDNTTFTEDFTFDIKGASITATNYGDVYKVGMQAWYIEAVKGDDLFMLELLSASTESPAGLYTQLTGALNEGYENKFIPGFLEDGLQGTWYAKLTNNTIKGDVMAPVVTGIIQVVIDESGATINFSNKDDAGFKIEGSISGKYTLNVIEEE
ncbi:MAG: hypothetical protein J6Q28_04295 [Alistipes sp.]|nr:hypothetical protein [Alistipes sp.]